MLLSMPPLCRWEAGEATQYRTLQGAQRGQGVSGTTLGAPHNPARDIPVAHGTWSYSPIARRFVEVPHTICSALR